jgi:hypothetical protein
MDKYSGYNHSIASILRGFDELATNDGNHSHGTPTFNRGYMLAITKAKNRLHELADAAQREIDECKAAQGG